MIAFSPASSWRQNAGRPVAPGNRHAIPTTAIGSAGCAPDTSAFPSDAIAFPL